MTNPPDHSRLPESGKPVTIRHWDPETDGPLSVEAVCQRLEDMGYTCTCHTYAPGTIFPEHLHDTDKIDVVLQGRFIITMHGTSRAMQSGDYVFIPRGTLHCAAVSGDEKVVSIDAQRNVDA